MTVDLPPAISHAMHVRGQPSGVFVISVDGWPPEKQSPAVCTRSLWSSFLPNQTRAASGVNYLVCAHDPLWRGDYFLFHLAGGSPESAEKLLNIQFPGS